MNRRRAALGDNAGLSLIEVLFAVALIGLAVVGTLPLLWSTVRASALQDRFAGARRWVVAAGDYAVTSSMTRIACTTSPNNTAAIITSYQTSLRTAAAPNRPAGWADTQMTVTGVKFWSGTAFSATCYEPTSPTLKMQQISLRVVSVDGTVTETLEVAKSDG
jgi:type II secretory pathway pseudopilin PulG